MRNLIVAAAMAAPVTTAPARAAEIKLLHDKLGMPAAIKPKAVLILGGAVKARIKSFGDPKAVAAMKEMGMEPAGS